MVLRHLLSVLLLPGMVAGVVPAWIRHALAAHDTRWPEVAALTWTMRGGSLVMMLGGLALASWCVALFARVGQGTLAPWDPTRRLVVVGPYRHVRNPMITGVALLLAAQALWAGSWILAAWLAIFLGVNHAFFLLVEEPGLVARFGEGYRVYTMHVPRWMPRRTPWHG
ncbi:Putative protein-S-isoprenylcysteine methyltransferase [Luteitalea pratensis]|uniref:Isoprenylcysteine carboxylmethyltransferase family protein n=1 Tax=Luteitalea pratensis TaxID=1855912 RepID=A0A143PN90_LUTPR|nr:methyltransferase [Luteitalea pratensis]AMY09896.1 Putative protein-S-isoprenylcysteine methyltransferase [Luteitalea pratensis]